MIGCPALFISAPASGQGKTTVTAALAHYHRTHGRRVRIFKTGPDYLDPMILERASGAPVYQLDLWMGGEAHCRDLISEAAREADLILIEGVMGLFDGERSSADIAILFGIPVLIVIDASAMAQTFGALAHGLATYRANLPVAGVFANRVAGESHYNMLIESLPANLAAFGWLPRDSNIALPERHLGLTQAGEIADLDFRIAAAATSLRGSAGALPKPVFFAERARSSGEALLRNRTIAVARDTAFSFLYRANLDLLQSLGAEVVFFSPLDDERLPAADAIYLPGGYPELRLQQLAANRSMNDAIRGHHAAGKPIVAECGGFLYLLDSLSDAYGTRATMVGLLSGNAAMHQKLVNLGLHSAQLPEGELKGHTFHYSSLDLDCEPIAHSRSARNHGKREAVYRLGRLTASYVHWYFPSNPAAAARLFLP